MSIIKSFLFKYFKQDEDGPVSWLAERHLTVPMALLASRLFMPKTEIVDGYVVMFNGRGEDVDDADRASLIECATKDPNLVESFNYVEPDFCFLFTGDVIPDEILDELYELMRQSWDAWLHSQYPDRKFEVFFMNEEELGGILGLGFRELSKNV